MTKTPLKNSLLQFQLAQIAKLTKAVCATEKGQRAFERVFADHLKNPTIQAKLCGCDQTLADGARGRIDSQSRELILEGWARVVTGEAGQIYRAYTGSDVGIDGELEFKDEAGNPTGQRLYLQLKSGDSYLSKRKRDGAEIFRIPKQRHVEYWMNQAYPVMLVIRNSDGDIRWMEIRNYLKQLTNNGQKHVRQIEFIGERFDVISVRRWRKETLRIHQ